MKTICVLQHVEAEYLGLMEDHLEGRGIRFRYIRPFVPGGLLPPSPDGFDGLVLLGAGPYGIVSSHLLASMGAELRLTREFLDRGLPVIGIGLGALLLCVAAGGGADDAPLRFEVGEVYRKSPEVLAGFMPERFPMAFYLRDRAILPQSATVLAEFANGEPAIFGVAGNSLGFIGPPGIKSGMIEDLVMEFTESPDDIAHSLDRLRAEQGRIAEALTDLMNGIIAETGWMTGKD